MSENKHRAGFVNIIGNPNVGKSTLMNALVGEKLSIVTAKAQTTRHRIMGIVNGEDFQIVYSDTPGILKPSYRLQQSMLNFVDTAIGDADIILYVTDTVEKADKNDAYIEKLRKVDCPVVVVINKIDLSSQEKVVALMQWWKDELPKAEIIPASAQEHFNLESILEAVSSRLPEAPAWFDKDQFTDKNLRFFASEILREKIFLNYPHRQGRRDAQESGDPGPAGDGGFLPEEGVPVDLCESGPRLAGIPQGAPPFRIRILK